MQFWQLCQNYSARNPKDSRSVSKSKRGFVSLDFCPLECSTGRVKCLTDEPGVFLQSRFSSQKPSKDLRLYNFPNKVLPKTSSGHVNFAFDILVENFGHKSGITSFWIRKKCQTFFLEETLLSQSFSLDILNAVVTTPLKTLHQETCSFLLIA